MDWLMRQEHAVGKGGNLSLWLRFDVDQCIGPKTCYDTKMKLIIPKAIEAGVLYFALIFALGFVLGTVRVLWLARLVGETLAVLAEQPIMLAASWFAASWLVRRQDLEALSDRAIMGGIAMALLFVAEIVLGLSLFGQTPSQSLTEALVLPGLIGLIGQVMFGLMPLLESAKR
jgi:hypothetical protein